MNSPSKTPNRVAVEDGSPGQAIEGRVLDCLSGDQDISTPPPHLARRSRAKWGNVEVVFSLGSNCGDREANVRDGIRWLSSILADCVSSPVYATPDAHGGARQYMNAVVKGYTDMAFEKMERLCKHHEIACGRTPEARAAGDVPIDIDVVVWNNDIIRPKDYQSEYFRIGYDNI